MSAVLLENSVPDRGSQYLSYTDEPSEAGTHTEFTFDYNSPPSWEIGSVATEPELSSSLRRVNRFLNRLDASAVPSIDEGEIRPKVPDGRFKTRGSPPIESRKTLNCLDPALMNHSDARLQRCNSDSEAPRYGCTGISMRRSRYRQKYVIEGRNGPVFTEKAPIGLASARNSKKFRQFVAAKQGQRAKTFSNLKKLSCLHNDGVVCLDKHQTNPHRSNVASFYQQRESLEDEYNQFDQTPPRHTQLERQKSNGSPTSIITDIVEPEKNDIEQLSSFVRVDPNIRGILKDDSNTGRRPKKGLTWWDDEINAHKPFLLKTDEIIDHYEYYDDYDDYEDSAWPSFPRNIGKCACTMDDRGESLKELLEDYSEKIKKSFSRLFDEDGTRNDSRLQNTRRGDHLDSLGDYLASLSEEERRMEVSALNIFADAPCGTVGDHSTADDRNSHSTMSLLKYIKDVMPPVFEFDSGRL